MRVPFERIMPAATAMFVLGVLFFLAAFVLLGGVSEKEPLYALRSLLAMSAMLLVIVSAALLFGILPLLAIAEVLGSQNDSAWKALWAIVLFLFSWLGLVAYLFIARKDLK